MQWLPAYLGLEHWLTAPLAVLIAVTIGGLIGLFQGWLIAYLGIPSFIVTLGGLLVWRGAAWWVTTGQTIAPMDTRFKAFGGGVEGALGATATWVIAAIACGGIIVALGLARRRRLRFGFPVRPGWADAVIAGICLRCRARSRRHRQCLSAACRHGAPLGGGQRHRLARRRPVHSARRRAAGADRRRGRSGR